MGVASYVKILTNVHIHTVNRGLIAFKRLYHHHQTIYSVAHGLSLEWKGCGQVVVATDEVV